MANIDKSKLELLQAIGEQVCEGCGPNRDCELEFDECMRLNVAVKVLDEWLVDRAKSIIRNIAKIGR